MCGGETTNEKIVGAIIGAAFVLALFGIAKLYGRGKGQKGTARTSGHD